nr:protein AMBP-like [Rhipicephalus microplus]
MLLIWVLIASAICATAEIENDSLTAKRQNGPIISYAQKNTTKLANTVKNSLTCEKRPAAGPCRSYQPTWYFDTRKQKCKMFIYGGCGGNENKFTSEHKCQQVCLPEKPLQLICSPKPTQGRCNVSGESWHFDSATATCMRYSPGTCPNGSNKFRSCEKCMKTCTNLKAKESCRILMEY